MFCSFASQLVSLAGANGEKQLSALLEKPAGTASMVGLPGVEEIARAWDELARSGGLSPERLARAIFTFSDKGTGSLSAENASKMYEDILARLSLVRAAAARDPGAAAAAREPRAAAAAPGNDALLRQLARVEDGISLINDLNNRHQYMQVPLQAGAGHPPLELFVMKRGGKKRKIDAENATLFLSVGTQNLGKVDALAHLGKNRSVSVCLRAADEAALNEFRASRPLLHEMLRGAGYKLSRATYKLAEEKLTPANAMREASKEFMFPGAAAHAVDIRT
jgi:hypothetical protein